MRFSASASGARRLAVGLPRYVLPSWPRRSRISARSFGWCVCTSSRSPHSRLRSLPQTTSSRPGPLLNGLGVILEPAARMTWKGLHPEVKHLEGEYPDGVRLTKKVMKQYEARVERSKT